MNFGVNPFMGLPGGLGMRGGAGCVDQVANSLELTYNEILREMNNKGKDLVQSDKDRIVRGIHQIKENNEKITKALQDLKAFASLNTALTHGLDRVSLKDVERASSLDSQINNLQATVNTISTDQVGLMTALLRQVLYPMALLSRGESSTFIKVA
jgi:cell division protein ZapA (FtsZ GTPase activity inhibitor)